MCIQKVTEGQAELDCVDYSGSRFNLTCHPKSNYPQPFVGGVFYVSRLEFCDSITAVQGKIPI